VALGPGEARIGGAVTVTNVRRLVLTNDISAAGNLGAAGIGNFRVALERRFIWGPLPSDAELAKFFGVRTKRQRLHWLDYAPQWRLEKIDAIGFGLIELCARYGTIELWIDPRPNDQLQLACLLHYLLPHRDIASKLALCQSDTEIANHMPEESPQWRPSPVKVGNDHFALGSRAWRAFAAPTPQDWFGLLAENLSVLPKLKRAVVRLLEELPHRATGLGATEMRMLRLISKGNISADDVFQALHQRNARRVFYYWEIGELLDGLTRCPAPAVSGLEEGPFTLELSKERYERYMRSQLSLTALGKAIVAGEDDFSWHNPIHRWWGGTELTNDRLWRWDPENKALVAP
jgi:hypothetical protein